MLWERQLWVKVINILKFKTESKADHLKPILKLWPFITDYID